MILGKTYLNGIINKLYVGYTLMYSSLIETFKARVLADGGTIDTVAYLNDEDSSAILIMNPSSYKDGKLYAFKPGDGSGDFSFARASIGTRINKDGLIETMGNNIARINHTFINGVKSGNPSLLNEGECVNLIPTSAGGIYGNGPGSTSNTTSPDGTNNAVIPVPDETADRYDFGIASGTYATDTKMAYSWYRKRITTPFDTQYTGDLRFRSLVNLTQVGSTTEIESNVNGFDRFESIFNITDGAASSILRSYFGYSIGVGNSSIAYFGHQLEVGTFSSSYIPTNGSAVIRSADVATRDLTGLGITSITETINGVVQAPITAILATYTIPNGKIQLVEMS